MRFRASHPGQRLPAPEVRGGPGVRRGAALSRMLLPLLGLGLIAAGAWFGLQKRSNAWTVSEVTQQMQRVALEGGLPTGDPSIGTLGPIRIGASGIDATTGEFMDFRIESERVIVVAERAILRVDPDKDTFAFDLFEVTFTRIPPMDETAALPDGEAPESFVHTVPRHLFGPTPFGRDIVPDGRGGGGSAPRQAARSGDPAGAPASRPASRPSGSPFGPRGASASERPSILRDAGRD